ncbi:MAG: SDR family NAD(P)-dependent oxidoreductase [Deltaproteobacteria bacterium]|nr:SDR family NAD(P)-dependent oxidoreductase [Deltaproteobacteria bacterium]
MAPVLVTQALAGLLRAAKKARVVNMTSWVGSIGDKDMPGYYGYSASKAALNMLTRLCALDLKRDRVIVAAIHPGWVRTDMGGPNAPLSPEKSVRKLLATVDALTTRQSGLFLNVDGRELNW